MTGAGRFIGGFSRSVGYVTGMPSGRMTIGVTSHFSGWFIYVAAVGSVVFKKFYVAW